MKEECVMKSCIHCRGVGSVSLTWPGTYHCDNCEGTGWIPDDQPDCPPEPPTSWDLSVERKELKAQVESLLHVMQDAADCTSPLECRSRIRQYLESIGAREAEKAQ